MINPKPTQMTDEELVCQGYQAATTLDHSIYIDVPELIREILSRWETEQQLLDIAREKLAQSESKKINPKLFKIDR